MPLQRKKRKKSGHGQNDANLQFATARCALYLRRYLKHSAFISEELITMISWTLIDQKERIFDFFKDDDLSDEDPDDLLDVNDLLDENELQVSQYSDLEYFLVENIKLNELRRFKRFIIGLLDEMARAANRNTGSEIEQNLIKLQELLNLSKQEVDFCLFFFIASVYDEPESFFSCHLSCHEYKGRNHLKKMLNIGNSEIERILNGALVKAGFLEAEHYEWSLSGDCIMLIQNSSDKTFASHFYTKTDVLTLPPDRFFIDPYQTEYVLNLLSEKRKTSTHILLYGAPGTGKTSFAYSLAEKLQTAMYEIVRGNQNTAVKRRASIIACLNRTNTGKGSIILADEADNLLNTRFSWFWRGETQDKGWLNQLLEEPGARMIWIVNEIDRIEDSVLRRFAFSICFKKFNRRQRNRLWNGIIDRHEVQDFFTASDITALAEKYQVSAGAIDLALAKTVETAPPDRAAFLKRIEMSLSAHQTLANGGSAPVRKDRIENNYAVDGLNAQGDLKAMIAQLEHFDRYLNRPDDCMILNMNLLFYGPPGAGKSELARYIAHHLGRELIVRHISDLQSKWVGEAEKNVKAAFEEAEHQEAVLVLDEADSLLFNRQHAHHSWEISFTNEFLTQMERFKGILICTTNLLEEIDQASLRRFNFKIGLDYLTAQGNLVFYERMLAPLVRESPTPADIAALQKIDTLTPGDFKTVRDQYYFRPPAEIHNEALINALAEETAFKRMHSGKKRVGF